MKTALCLIAAALPLVAQPKLLVNAQTDTRSAAAGLEQTLRPLLSAAPPAWIGYSVPSTRSFMGCDYVRDGLNQPGVIHLEPPDHAVILFRVEGGELVRLRTLSPDCEIDAGGLPVHWLNDVKPAESVTLLTAMAEKRDRFSDSALSAISHHADPAAADLLKKYATSDPDLRYRERAISMLGSRREPDTLDLIIEWARRDPNSRIRMAAINALNRRSGQKVVDTLRQAVESDPDMQVKRRAISSLQSMPDGEGVPTLIQLARTTKEPEIRKQAMNSLGNSHDRRAVSFFESVLK